MEFEATIPAVDSGRLLMEIPLKATTGLKKEPLQKVTVTIDEKVYLCNLFYKENSFWLHIIRGIKREVGLGVKTTFIMEPIVNVEAKKEEIHDQVLQWETTTCKSLMKQVGVKQEDYVVDFGCGYGHYTLGCALALEQSGVVFAVDCDAKALKWINKKEQMYKIDNIKTIQTNGMPVIDFPDNSVDVVLLYDIGHIHEKGTKKSLAPNLFKEAYRVLKKGGILSTLNFNSDIKKMRFEDEKTKIIREDIDAAIVQVGFSFSHIVASGVHFDWYHSRHRLKKGLLFADLEREKIYNYVK